MKLNKSYWLISFTTLLLLGLLVNQVIYIYKAAAAQEKAFNDKVAIVLDIIENKISENTTFCKSVDKCLFMNNNKYCSTALQTKKDWQMVDSIITEELQKFDIDLNYNFDFCSRFYAKEFQKEGKKRYLKNMDKVFQKSGVILFLEFPEKSKYVFLQIGSVFFSSILFILLITLLFIITFRFYKREKMVAETMKDFLNNMMHEFKTPLTNISFANNMISKEIESNNPNKIKKYSEIINTENRRIIDNCEDILEYSKQENLLSTSFNDTINLHRMIEEIQQSFLIIHPKSTLSIKLQLNASNYLVKGKTSFLYNAISNLVDNAIKYCENTPNIIITTQKVKEQIIFTIFDNGIGISKENITMVFDKFYRVSTGNRHDVKGFGLGLAYVRLIVENMKGEILLQSEQGKGSTFIIKLPLDDA